MDLDLATVFMLGIILIIFLLDSRDKSTCDFCGKKVSKYKLLQYKDKWICSDCADKIR